MKKIIVLIIFGLLISCNSSAQKPNKKTYKVLKTETEWKAQLSDLEYHVLREAGTERSFTSHLYKNHAHGVYLCKGCDTPLFKSEHKFNSGAGWPSFDREIKGNVEYSKNGSEFYGYEEHCATCGGHLGHIFNDGPKNTTGKRHCINGVSLKFVPSK